MPFSRVYSLTKEQWAEIFERKIKQAVEESGLGYRVQRYELRRANITKAILQEINSAHLVVADLTGKNPNVLWELGVRHTLSKRTILIAQDKKFLPSDLKDYPIILYKYKQSPAEVDKFKDDIKKKLEDIEADPNKADNPVADFLELKNIDIVSYEKSAIVKKLNALISELSRNIDKVTPILNTASKNQELRKKGNLELTISSERFETACLELLVSSNYIAIPENLLRETIELHNKLITNNKGLDLWQNAGYAKSVEKNFIEELPSDKDELVSLLVGRNEIRLDYINNNYLEPPIPPLVLSIPEHEKYIRLST